MNSAISNDRPFDLGDGLDSGERVAVINELAARGQRVPIVSRLARLARVRATQLRINKGLSGPPTQRELAASALQVTQRAGYVRELPPSWFQPVAWTVSHGGDCEDLTPMLMAICAVLGIPARAYWFDQPDRPLNHVVTQILVEGSWLWADASVCGARLGEYPYAAIERLGAWHVLDSNAPGGACSAF